jgi:leader peptidase (prepilin peptidase)/N-methyltransferase
MPVLGLDTAAVEAGLVAGVLAGVGGLLVPRLVRSLPEPEPPAEPHPDEPPKPPYVDLAARPRLAAWCALVSLVAGLLVGATTGREWWLVALVPLLPVGVALGYIDWHTRLLPSRIVLPGLAYVSLVALVGTAVTGDVADLVRAAVGGAAAWAFYCLLWFINAAGMGYGDVRLSALLGAALAHRGWGEFAIGMYVPFLLFGLPGLALAIVRRDRTVMKRAYPFGPSMLVGLVIGVVLGPWVWDALTSPV